MVRYAVEPVTTYYADGKPAVRMVEDGSGMVYYKSGRIALVVQQTSLGFIQQVFDDNATRSVLMHFNEIGEGSCTWPPVKGAQTGHPRYLCDKQRGKFVNEVGEITREWLWEAPIGSSWTPDIPEEWSFNLNSYWSFKASSRQDQDLVFRCDSVTHSFQVGQIPKRRDTYLDHVVKWEHGKAVLDVLAKTQTYHTAKASSTTADFDETAGAAVEGESDELAATMGSMDLSRTIDSESLRTAEAAVQAKTDGMRNGAMAVMPFVEPEAMDLNRSLVTNPRVDVGGPQPTTMTVINDEVVGGMGAYHRSTKLDRRFAMNSGGYHQPLKNQPTKKKKLDLITTKKYDSFLRAVPKTQLVLMAVLDDGNQTSRQVDLMLQDKWGEVCAMRDPAATGVEDDRGRVTFPTMPIERLPYRIAKFSHTESRMLIKRYNFHNAPMFLFYAGAKLVHASPVLGTDGMTRRNLDAAVEVCLERAEAESFMPDDFQFGVGAGMSLDQAGPHDELQLRIGEMAAMLDAGRERRVGKGKR